MASTITIKLWTNNESAAVTHIQTMNSRQKSATKSALMLNREKYQES